MYTQTINLNMIPSGVPPVIHVNQYEYQNNAFTFKLFNGASAFNIPDEASVLMNGLKPDGNVFSYASTSHSGNSATFNCQQQMVPLAGYVVCELRVRTASEIVGTCNFLLKVEEAPLHDDSVISETTIPLIEQAIDIAANLAEYIDMTMNAANVATNAADTATSAANNASVYNSNVEQMYNSLEDVKTAARTAAQNAQNIADTVQDMLDDGLLKGDKGDKGDTGDPGESGINVTAIGMFCMSVDANGDLWVYSDDQSDIGDSFEYDSETGILEYVFTYDDEEDENDGDNTGNDGNGEEP